MVARRSDEDDLDAFVAEQQHDPAFAAAYEAAVTRSRVLRSLVERRKAMGISQATVADHMGTTQSSVSELEAGDLDFRLSTIQRYAGALGFHVDVSLRDGRLLSVPAPCRASATQHRPG